MGGGGGGAFGKVYGREGLRALEFLGLYGFGGTGGCVLRAFGVSGLWGISGFMLQGSWSRVVVFGAWGQLYDRFGTR